MDFLLEEIASGIFWPAAHLLNLGVGIVFVDTTSTYWEMDAAAGLAEIAGDDGRGKDAGSRPGRRAPAGSGTPRATGMTCRRW